MKMGNNTVGANDAVLNLNLRPLNNKSFYIFLNKK